MTDKQNDVVEAWECDDCTSAHCAVHKECASGKALTNTTPPDSPLIRDMLEAGDSPGTASTRAYPNWKIAEALRQAMGSSTPPAEQIAENANCLAGELTEDLNLCRDLIQQAKGVDGPKGGFVTDSLDAAESHLDSIEAILSHLQAAPSGDVVGARCGDVGSNLCNACSQPIGDLTQVPGCGGPFTTPPSNQEATLRKMGENAAQAAKDYAADIQALTERNQVAEALLREVLNCAYQAIGDIRYPPIGDSAQRRIEYYQKLADSIEAHLKDLPQ